LSDTTVDDFRRTTPPRLPCQGQCQYTEPSPSSSQQSHCLFHNLRSCRNAGSATASLESRQDTATESASMVQEAGRFRAVSLARATVAGSVLWLSSMCDARHRQQSVCTSRLAARKEGRDEAKMKRRLDWAVRGVMVRGKIRVPIAAPTCACTSDRASTRYRNKRRFKEVNHSQQQQHLHFVLVLDPEFAVEFAWSKYYCKLRGRSTRTSLSCARIIMLL